MEDDTKPCCSLNGTRLFLVESGGHWTHKLDLFFSPSHHSQLSVSQNSTNTVSCSDPPCRKTSAGLTLYLSFMLSHFFFSCRADSTPWRPISFLIALRERPESVQCDVEAMGAVSCRGHAFSHAAEPSCTHTHFGLI